MTRYPSSPTCPSSLRPNLFETVMRRLSLLSRNCSPLLAHIYEINLLYYFP